MKSLLRAGIALALAEAGADVVVNYSSGEDKARVVCNEIEKFGVRALAVGADVSDETQVQKMFARMLDEFGTIDILVNNAGIETIIPFLELTDDQWTRLVDVNLRGAWLHVLSDALGSVGALALVLAYRGRRLVTR